MTAHEMNVVAQRVRNALAAAGFDDATLVEAADDEAIRAEVCASTEVGAVRCDVVVTVTEA